MPSGIASSPPGSSSWNSTSQNQLKAATDRRAKHRDLEEQIRKKRGSAEQEQAHAKDDTEFVGRGGMLCKTARLNIKKNVYLGRIEAQERTSSGWKRLRRSRKQLIATFEI